jgi:hypothetical protein
VLSGLQDVVIVEGKEGFSLTLVDGAALELALSSLEFSR